MENPLLQSKKVKQYIKEGRGQGEGKHYQPWTKTYSREFSSKGRVTRIMGVKTGRLHYLQSDNQYRAFLTFEFNENVVDIRESYPLIDIFETVDEIEDLRFDKFRNRETKEPYVLTTNFLITVNKNNERKLIARTVKNVSELNRKLTLEKLEIERRYWLAKKVDWKVITNRELSKQRAKNIEWVRETLLDSNLKGKEVLSEKLLLYLLQNNQVQIRTLLRKFDHENNLDSGTALYLFRYLIARHQLEVNLNSTIKLTSTIMDLLEE